MVAKSLGIVQWVQLVQAEYNEMPGLHLTNRQVQRLWGLDQATCEALLCELEGVGFLRRTSANSWVKHDLGC